MYKILIIKYIHNIKGCKQMKSSPTYYYLNFGQILKIMFEACLIINWIEFEQILIEPNLSQL